MRTGCRCPQLWDQSTAARVVEHSIENLRKRLVTGRNEVDRARNPRGWRQGTAGKPQDDVGHAVRVKDDDRLRRGGAQLELELLNEFQPSERRDHDAPREVHRFPAKLEANRMSGRVESDCGKGAFGRPGHQGPRDIRTGRRVGRKHDGGGTSQRSVLRLSEKNRSRVPVPLPADPRNRGYGIAALAEGRAAGPARHCPDEVLVAYEVPEQVEERKVGIQEQVPWIQCLLALKVCVPAHRHRRLRGPTRGRDIQQIVGPARRGIEQCRPGRGARPVEGPAANADFDELVGRLDLAARLAAGAGGVFWPQMIRSSTVALK